MIQGDPLIPRKIRTQGLSFFRMGFIKGLGVGVGFRERGERWVRVS